MFFLIFFSILRFFRWNYLTGSNISKILGVLGVDGGANLLLMNPNGIIFGENAAINVNGSFLATTAESINFNSGEEFSAVAPKEPLLTIDFPIGLGFASKTGSITVKGSGHGLRNPAFLPIDRENSPTGLSVQSGESFSLIGGDINFDGGVVKHQGEINIGSVDNGFVKLELVSSGWNFNYSDVTSFKNINLFGRASIDASGTNSSSINIQGQNINVEGSSVVLLQNQSTEQAGTISIDASSSLSIKSNDPAGETFSAVRNETAGLGEGGDISITTENLKLQDGGQINAFSFSSAPSGNILINAPEAITLSGVSTTAPDIGSDIASSTFNSGNAGNITVSTKNLAISNGASITSVTFGTGNGGNIDIAISNSTTIFGIELSVFSSSALATITFGSGNGGELNIDTPILEVLEGGQITSSTFADGNAGNITANVSDFVMVSGNVIEAPNSTSITSSAATLSEALRQVFRLPSIPSGNSGKLEINTRKLIVADGASIGVQNDGTGEGGESTVNASSISLNNGGEISASTLSGQGGNITLNTDNLELRNQSQITASAGGSGDGGNITIDSDTILGIGNSDITANAVSGDGGNITIDSDFVVGLEAQSELTPFNDITATSEFGIDGTVTVNAPDNNLGDDAVVVFGNYPQPEDPELLERRCLNPRNPEGKLIYVGRGGVPENPDNFFGDEDIVAVDRIGTDKQTNENGETPLWVEGDPIIDSNAVRIGKDGDRYLVAETKLKEVDSSICTRQSQDDALENEQ